MRCFGGVVYVGGGKRKLPRSVVLAGKVEEREGRDGTA